MSRLLEVFFLIFKGFLGLLVSGVLQGWLSRSLIYWLIFKELYNPTFIPVNMLTYMLQYPSQSPASLLILMQNVEFINLGICNYKLCLWLIDIYNILVYIKLYLYICMYYDQCICTIWAEDLNIFMFLNITNMKYNMYFYYLHTSKCTKLSGWGVRASLLSKMWMIWVGSTQVRSCPWP